MSLPSWIFENLVQPFAKVLLAIFVSAILGSTTAIFFVGSFKKNTLSYALILSVVFSGLYIYLFFMMFGYLSIAKIPEFDTYCIAVFTIPLIFKRTRASLRLILQSVKIRFELEPIEAIMLAVAGTFIFANFMIAVTSYPTLDDPLTVWLFYGKQIFLTGRIPLYFGNAADISWSGNYPPMRSFFTSALFFTAGSINAYYASMLPWMFGLFTVVATYILAVNLNGGRKGGLISVTILLSISVFSMQMAGWGYLDTISTFYITAFLAIVTSGVFPSNESIFISTLTLSMALLSDYTILLLLPQSLLLLFLFQFSKSRRKQFSLPTPLIFGLVLIGLGGSWFVRNWILVGDPVYPYLYTIFNARGINPSIIGLIPIYKPLPAAFIQDGTYSQLMNQGNQWPFFFGIGAIAIVVVLWALRFLGISRSGVNYVFEGETLHKLFLFSIWASLSLVTIAIFVFVRGGFIRYFIIVAPACAAVGGSVFALLLGDGSDTRNPAQIKSLVRKFFRNSTYLLLFLLSLTTVVVTMASPLYISYRPSETNMWSFINNLPPGTVATNDIRLFFFNHTIVQLYNIPSLFNATSEASVYAALSGRHVSYVYFNLRFDAEVFSQRTLLLPTLQNSSYFVRIYSAGNYLVYRRV